MLMFVSGSDVEAGVVLDLAGRSADGWSGALEEVGGLVDLGGVACRSRRCGRRRRTGRVRRGGGSRSSGRRGSRVGRARVSTFRRRVPELDLHLVGVARSTAWLRVESLPTPPPTVTIEPSGRSTVLAWLRAILRGDWRFQPAVRVRLVEQLGRCWSRTRCRSRGWCRSRRARAPWSSRPLGWAPARRRPRRGRD